MNICALEINDTVSQTHKKKIYIYMEKIHLVGCTHHFNLDYIKNKVEFCITWNWGSLMSFLTVSVY